ncbi:hypothetical protein SJAG_02512 [Schizosaccharomyces japonicus yFS275]|uniref:Ubiquitin-like domain-containing protein n=1 Tax=Schizosaccharomyces japonicus (strain yFS275 / FY16936) TaxID=402676 RepID=B6K2P6_SCHJY|nr:hypothetical protein SJAG_02512 [Schizosaccharomyces japonicus yFS275]EEB07427.1 hypothetical protein SJAG_02512 [Schizosaccharomyces japonicus yFS275]
MSQLEIVNSALAELKKYPVKHDFETRPAIPGPFTNTVKLELPKATFRYVERKTSKQGSDSTGVTIRRIATSDVQNVDISSHSTVYQLKEQLSNSFHIPLANVKLLVEGKLLADTSVLDDVLVNTEVNDIQLVLVQ